MKNINDITTHIKSIVMRLLKNNKDIEYIYSTIYNYVQDEVVLTDNIYEEIINLILTEGNITIQELIEDINTAFEKEHKNKIKNKTHLIKYIKQELSNIQILKEPLIHLFDWSLTYNQYWKYFDIHFKIRHKLKVLYCMLHKQLLENEINYNGKNSILFQSNHPIAPN